MRYFYTVAFILLLFFTADYICTFDCISPQKEDFSLIYTHHEPLHEGTWSQHVWSRGMIAITCTDEHFSSFKIEKNDPPKVK